jgi:hypothetical protein
MFIFYFIHNSGKSLETLIYRQLKLFIVLLFHYFKSFYTNNIVWLNTISNFLINKMFQYRILLRLNICEFFSQT